MKYVLFLIAILLSTQALAINCAQAPSCEELGYSTQNNSNCLDDGYLICPFDSQYKKCVNFNCESLGFTKSEKSDWCGKLAFCPNDKSYTACKALCEIGDVYYSDGTCGYAQDYDASLGKTPAGVVYYVSDGGRHGKVINLKNLGKNASDRFNPADPYNSSTRFVWGIENDISNLENWHCDSFKSAAQTENRTTDFWSAGENYTDIIASYQSDDLQYPAPAARAFYPPQVQPDNPIVGHGQWYLPTIGELMDLFGYNYQDLGINTTCDKIKTGAKGTTKEIVNNTLKGLKNKNVDAEEFSEDKYLSSSEYNDVYFWTLDMKDGMRVFHSKHYSFYVRTSLAF